MYIFKIIFIELHISFQISFLYAWIVVFISRSVIEICWSCVIWLCLLCWSHVFGGTDLLLPLSYFWSVLLVACIRILLVVSQKFFEWETFPQIKCGDAGLDVPVWFHSFKMACPCISVICNIISVKRIKFVSIPFIPVSVIQPYLWRLSSAHLSNLCCLFITLQMNFNVLFFLWRCSPNRS
jgi:hypothetical protein